MRPIAFLSMDDLSGYVCDDDLAIPPLESLGWKVETVSWKDISADWRKYEAVIVRSSWDYQNHFDSFLAVLAEIDSCTRLINPLPMMRWNAEKGYLRELESAGISVVRTLWDNHSLDSALIDEYLLELGTEEIVVKPTVSAGAIDTFRLTRDAAFHAEANSRFTGRAYMVQPFMQGVVNEGEYSLFFFGGQFSHAILKSPKAGDFRVQEEHGGDMCSVSPNSELRELSLSVLSRLSSVPLYARVDFVRASDGGFQLMELELIEPSLYLRMDPSSPEKFARAIDRFLAPVKTCLAE